MQSSREASTSIRPPSGSLQPRIASKAPNHHALGDLPVPKSGKALAAIMSGVKDVLMSTGKGPPECLCLAVARAVLSSFAGHLRMRGCMTIPQCGPGTGDHDGRPSSFTGFHWRFFERYLDSIRPLRDASGAFPDGVLPPMHTWIGYFMSLSMCAPSALYPP